MSFNCDEFIISLPQTIPNGLKKLIFILFYLQRENMITRSSKKEKTRSSKRVKQKQVGIRTGQNLSLLEGNMVDDTPGHMQVKDIHRSARSPEMGDMEHGLTMVEHGFEFCSSCVVPKQLVRESGRQYE